MPFLGDVQRVAVIGAQRHKARAVLVEDFRQGIEVLGDRALADQDGHALGELFARLCGAGGFVIGADAGGEIAIERLATQQRRMPVDMAVLEGEQLCQNTRIGVEHAGEVHHLGEADHLWVAAERQQVLDVKTGTGGLERGRGHAGGEIDAHIHDGALGTVEEVANALGAQHIGDLMRITERGGDAIGEDAAVEFQRGDQRGFDVQMRVDEARHGEAPAAVNNLLAVIAGMGAHDAVRDNGDIGGGDGAGNHVEQADIADDDVGRLFSLPGHDHAGQKGRAGHGLGLGMDHAGKSACRPFSSSPCSGTARNRRRRVPLV